MCDASPALLGSSPPGPPLESISEYVSVYLNVHPASQLSSGLKSTRADTVVFS